eukprot:CAMPEP_0117599226 /NCGR_PEP_ID=MMETSP0784-20121206/75830_1 /TAXON_ID=39447 /ORGANISM="" /LENGTH=545 /DNA_ID=CAMNT_0005401755 /DNA_START=85 /DNA_END=1722 /DNA_ORIENTATION=-
MIICWSHCAVPRLFHRSCILMVAGQILVAAERGSAMPRQRYQDRLAAAADFVHARQGAALWTTEPGAAPAVAGVRHPRQVAGTLAHFPVPGDMAGGAARPPSAGFVASTRTIKHAQGAPSSQATRSSQQHRSRLWEGMLRASESAAPASLAEGRSRVEPVHGGLDQLDLSAVANLVAGMERRSGTHQPFPVQGAFASRPPRQAVQAVPVSNMAWEEDTPADYAAYIDTPMAETLPGSAGYNERLTTKALPADALHRRVSRRQAPIANIGSSFLPVAQAARPLVPLEASLWDDGPLARPAQHHVDPESEAQESLLHSDEAEEVGEDPQAFEESEEPQASEESEESEEEQEQSPPASTYPQASGFFERKADVTHQPVPKKLGKVERRRGVDEEPSEDEEETSQADGVPSNSDEYEQEADEHPGKSDGGAEKSDGEPYADWQGDSSSSRAPHRIKKPRRSAKQKRNKAAVPYTESVPEDVGMITKDNLESGGKLFEEVTRKDGNVFINVVIESTPKGEASQNHARRLAGSAAVCVSLAMTWGAMTLAI